jgi:flagellar biosynthesis/type III secretory pathway protein FliH
VEAKSLSPDPAVRLHSAPSGTRLAGVDLASVETQLVQLARAREEGRQQALMESAGALDNAVQQLDQARTTAVEDLSRTCVTLAVEIARELVQQEFDAGRYDLESIVRDSLAVSGVPRGESVIVHIHPADAAALEGIAFRAGTEVVADPEVERGDVHTTTPHGTLVRDLDHALTSITERLRGDLE